MVCDKKDLDLLNIYENGDSCCLVLAVGSASDRISVKCSAVFKKMPKPRNFEVVTCRKHFSHSSKNMV